MTSIINVFFSIFERTVGRILKFFSPKPSVFEEYHSSKFQLISVSRFRTNKQTHWYPIALEERYLNRTLTWKLLFSLIEAKLSVYLIIFLSINLSLHLSFYISTFIYLSYFLYSVFLCIFLFITLKLFPEKYGKILYKPGLTLYQQVIQSFFIF